MDTAKDNFFNLLGLVKKHEKWMGETINLIASENRLSPLVNETLKSDFGNRVAEGWIGERVFPGIKYYDQIERYGTELACKMFHADFADIRPISGTMANMIIFSAFTNHGDTVASISIPSGAHTSMAGTTPKKVFGLKVVELPFNKKNFTIDLEASAQVIRATKPKILILGGSVLLFSQPVKELAKVCKEIGTIVLFDASHIAGLVATGLFPNPLDDGAHIMTMTMCKTIPGPQHAFILSRAEFAEKIKRTTFPGFLSGHHLHETVASVLAVEELKKFGQKYIQQVLLNTKMLASYLSGYGFDVLAKDKGFTNTHMLLINISSILPAIEAESLLEKVNIIVNRNMLPENSSFLHPDGLRLGAAEMTRLGAKEKDMATIALFFKKLFLLKSNPADIKKEVVEFRKSFNKIHYCYQDNK